RLENEHENDTEHDESELEERHFREYVSRASAADVLEDDEADMIQSVFEMDDTLVRAVMRPRIDVVWLDSGTSLDDAVEIFIASGYSRFPFVGDSPDDVLGIVFLKGLCRALHTNNLPPDYVVNLSFRDIRGVPESKTFC